MTDFFKRLQNKNRKLIKKAYKNNLVEFSSDAYSVGDHGYWVATEKLEAFIDFVKEEHD